MSRVSATEEFRRLQDAALAEVGVTATSRFVDIPTPPLHVHVLEAGVEGAGGDPVLMVHGGYTVAASWAPLLPKLAARFHLLMPDRPGCGLTTPPFNYRGVDLRQHGIDYLRGVLDALGQKRVAIVANSMGGYFAMALAIAHPERVSKLALLGEPAGSGINAPTFHRLVGTRGINAFLYATALRPPKDAAGTRAGFVRNRLVADPSRISETLLQCFAASLQLPGAVLAWRTMVEQIFVPRGMGVFAEKMVLTRAMMPELGKLTAPTLFLWGEKDPLGKPEVGRMLAAEMPHARVEVVEDAGHLPWLDKPDFCADAVTAFLAE